ncbi:MAG: DUF3667 domain-containing protein [Lysobacteraceae bacterium]
MTDATDCPPTTPAAPVPTGAVCANCGTPLYGEHCYHCGQPVQGLVRRFSSVLGDVADTLFEIDTRLTRTVVPLLLRPGYLSIEYFAGRRVRYVSPVRLFFFLSVIAFFVAQWTFDAGNTKAFQVNDDDISSAMTVAGVEAQRDIALHAIQANKKVVIGIPGASNDLSAAELAITRKADQRIAQLKTAQAEGKPPPEDQPRLTFGSDGKPWDPVTNPINFSRLPAFTNRWFNQLAGQTQGNLARIQHNPKLLFDAWMSAVPSTLFLLLPLFAMLLKIAYLFKRRLYMEHFIVALHSHAFLCFALLLALVLNGLAGVTPSPWLNTPLQAVKVVLIVWMPLYLLLMQKRVYRQGWSMTLIKYFALATVYLVLLSLGAAASLVVKLVWL